MLTKIESPTAQDVFGPIPDFMSYDILLMFTCLPHKVPTLVRKQSILTVA